MNAYSLKQLQDVCDINPTLQEKKLIAPDMPVAFVPMAAVDEHNGEIVGAEVRRFETCAKGYTSFAEGDVLFAKITPCMENGKAAIARELPNGLGFGSTEFHVLRPHAELLPEFLFYIVRHRRFRELAKANFTGTAGQQRVPADFLRRVAVPIPPVDEQRRIVDLLNRAGGLKRLSEQGQAKARELIVALFVGMFGDPATNPKGWQMIPLGDVAVVGSGAGFPKTDQGVVDQQYPFLKVSDMNLPGNDRRIVAWNNSVSEITRRRLKAKAFPPGAVIFPKIGAAIATNKKRLLTRPSCVDNNVMAISPTNELRSEYLYGLMLLKDLSDFASKSDLPSMRQSDVQAWSIPLPPDDVQEEFASRLATIESVELLAAKASQTAEQTSAALMSQVFAS